MKLWIGNDPGTVAIRLLNSAVKFQKLNRRGHGPNCRLGMRLLLLKCVIAANNFPYARWYGNAGS